MEVTTRDPRTLAPHPRNYRAHPDDQVAHIAESIRLRGFYRPVVISSDGVILAGHGLVQAAIVGGYTEIPVIEFPYPSQSPESLALMVADNEISHTAEIDDRKLTDMLRELYAGIGLLGTGFDESQLAALTLTTRMESEIPDFDAAAEWLGDSDLPQTEDDDLLRVVVRFRTPEARAAFCSEVAADKRVDKRSDTTWSFWGEE